MRAASSSVDQLLQGRPFVLFVEGSCMIPHLFPGQRLSAEPARAYRIGDIVVVRESAPSNRLLVHRVIGLYRRQGRWRLVTKAETGRRPDTAVSLDRVLGQVAQVDGAALHIRWRDRLRAAWCFAAFALARLVRSR